MASRCASAIDHERSEAPMRQWGCVLLAFLASRSSPCPLFLEGLFCNRLMLFCGQQPHSICDGECPNYPSERTLRPCQGKLNRSQRQKGVSYTQDVGKLPFASPGEQRRGNGYRKEPKQSVNAYLSERRGNSGVRKHAKDQQRQDDEEGPVEDFAFGHIDAVPGIP